MDLLTDCLWLQSNIDVMAVEKEREIEEKHRQLARRVKKSQKMMQEVNAAKVAEQSIRRQRLFRTRAEEVEAQKAETIAHLDEVDKRLREKQQKVEDRIERQKKEAVEREMGRAVAFEEKEKSMMEVSMQLEEKRAAKEMYMESVAEARERERIHEIEAQKLQYVARVEQVKRLRRAKAFEAVMKKEEFEEKELKTNTLLETKKKLVEEQRVGAVHFSVQSETVRKKNAKGLKALYGPTTQIPDYGIWNSPNPVLFSGEDISHPNPSFYPRVQFIYIEDWSR